MIELKELRILTQNLKVLYVEDDSAIAKTMLQYLKKFFNLVVYAYDGLDGLKKYKNEPFDIVITDLSMPNMNGLEMIEKIKKIDVNQEILITTAHSESQYLFGAIKAGIDGYIIKPFDFNQLNQELFKISSKLQKFYENEKYKSHLKEIVEEKTYELKNIVDFQSDNYEKTLLSMVEMIEQRDTYTAGHSKRVAKYCNLIAKEMGYLDEECTMLHQAAILHDIGKIGTPDAVLLNPKKLNDIEYKLIQEHVRVGYIFLNNIPMFKQLAEIVYSHHERYDGGGYPRGLKNKEILPLARIMIVADAFDAMTTSRVYKSRKSVSDALAELNDLSSKQFHPDVVKSAIVVLRGIDIDENINQLPKTKLEEERFAYFYKDNLSKAYNQNYLDVVLVKNSYQLEYKNMAIIYLKNFTYYNKKYGWKKGDQFLQTFSNIICETLKTILVFRVFGDDFVLLSKDLFSLDLLKGRLDEVVEDIDIEYNIRIINLNKNIIKSIEDIEKL